MTTATLQRRQVRYDLRGYTPHPGQKHFHESRARFRVLACGRRWGKDMACEYEVLDRLPELLERNKGRGLVPPVLVWDVSPTYPISEQAWAEYKAFTPPGFMVDIREGDKCIKGLGGAEIWMKTAADPEHLVGVGLDLLLMREAALVSEDAWTTGLRPMLSSPGRAGLALFNSTPKGLNWFYKMYLRGQDPQDTEVESWNSPTWDNPYILAAEVEKARLELPETVFRQEYGAEFLADVGLVFRHVDGCVQGELQEPIAGHGYEAGIDLAKHNDFTVLIIGSKATRRVVHFERFGEMDYALQKERISTALKRYNNAHAWLDSTGVGDPILEDLQRMGLRVEGYTFTATSKRQLVDGLSVALEQERIRFPRIDQLINELKAYQYETTKAGNLRTTAPYGYYDDCVAALGLLNYGLGQSGSWNSSANGGKPIRINYSQGVG